MAKLRASGAELVLPAILFLAGSAISVAPPLAFPVPNGAQTSNSPSSNQTADQTVLPAKPPTFYKDVLPILQAHCQRCHRPGEIGPMPLVTYEQTRRWSKAIAQAVESRKMPPWFADPQYGRFSNDPSLST